MEAISGGVSSGRFLRGASLRGVSSVIMLFWGGQFCGEVPRGALLRGSSPEGALSSGTALLRERFSLLPFLSGGF